MLLAGPKCVDGEGDTGGLLLLLASFVDAASGSGGACCYSLGRTILV